MDILATFVNAALTPEHKALVNRAMVVKFGETPRSWPQTRYNREWFKVAATELDIRVELLERGAWDGGAHKVLPRIGRTDDHLVLQSTTGNVFEVFCDAPYNVRSMSVTAPVEADAIAQISTVREFGRSEVLDFVTYEVHATYIGQDTPTRVQFTGKRVATGAPVQMLILSGSWEQINVTQPERFGAFSDGWVRRFFGGDAAN